MFYRNSNHFLLPSCVWVTFWTFPLIVFCFVQINLVWLLIFSHNRKVIKFEFIVLLWSIHFYQKQYGVCYFLMTSSLTIGEGKHFSNVSGNLQFKDQITFLMCVCWQKWIWYLPIPTPNRSQVSFENNIKIFTFRCLPIFSQPP